MNNETKTPRKDIIKNIAIVFLAAMLVLTLFSNTFMNYSLPQVSAIYVSQGTISEQIRGSGTVEPAESYEVKIDQTRDIKSVSVKTGQEVKAGDVLFELADQDSTELTEAQNTLDSLQLEYDKAMLALSAASGYETEYLEISNAEKELDRLKDQLYAAENKTDALSISSAEYKEAKSEADRLTREKDHYNTQLSSVDSEDMLDLDGSYYDRLRAAKDAVTDADKKAEEAQKEYDEAAQKAAAEGDHEEEVKSKQKEIRMAQSTLNELYTQYYNAGPETDVSSISVSISNKSAEIQELRNDLTELVGKSTQDLVLKNKLNQAEQKLKKSQKALTDAKNKLSSEIRSIKLEIKDKIDDINDRLIIANDRLAAAEESKSEAEASGLMSVTQLNTKIRDQEKTIADLRSKLSLKQSTDSIEAQTARLDLEAKLKTIEQQKEKVAKLKGEAFDAKVTAKMGGIVERISVTAGETAAAGTIAAVINVSDKGYTLQFPVKTEQSKKVKVGDKAEITSWYWGNDFSAVLSEIRPDTNNPQTQKLLVFTIQGSDISTGQNISLAMGSKGQPYSTVVPNSAVREDSNGSFVLVMESRSSPLGNRYKAVRYDIEVLAKDDNYTAVNGLMGSEFVITTSTKPISAGEQVRPADD